MFAFSERHVTAYHYNDKQPRDHLSHTVDRDALIIW